MLFDRRSAIASSHDLLTHLLGSRRSKAGPLVNEMTALNVSAVLTCVSLRSRALASLPCRTYERIDERNKKPAVNHPTVRLYSRPNGWQTRPELFGMLEGHRVLRGNAYAWKNVVLDAGVPVVRELIPMHPDRVEVLDEPDDFGGPTTYKLHRRNGQTLPLASREVLHLKGFSTDGRMGREVLADLRELIGGSLAAQDCINTLWNEDGVPPVILRHPNTLQDEPAEKLEKRWQETYGRGGDKRRVAVLEEGMDIRELALKPTDMELLKNGQDMRRQIYGVMHVPSHMAGDTEKNTSWGTGIEQMQIGFLTFTMQPDLVTWEARLDRDCILDDPERFYTKFSIQGFLRGDSRARAEFYERMWRMGVFSINDILAFEDMNPVDGGDVRFVPMNFLPLGTPVDDQVRAAAIVGELIERLRTDGVLPADFGKAA